MFKPEEIESKKGLIGGLGAVVFILGGVFSYFMARFADKYAVPLISGWCGGIISFMVIGGLSLPGPAKILIIAMVAGATVHYSYKVQRFVKSAGTAMIGAFILFNGIGNYVGGYPSIMSTQSEGGAEDAALENLNSKEGAMALFYLGGTVAFTALGTWFQLSYIVKKVYKEDDFMNPDDS
jgi:MFS family permease